MQLLHSIVPVCSEGVCVCRRIVQVDQELTLTEIERGTLEAKGVGTDTQTWEQVSCQLGLSIDVLTRHIDIDGYRCRWI